MSPIQQFLGYVSTAQLLGFIPLDILFHFVGGTVITLIGLKLKYSFKNVCLVLFGLELIKEFYDSFTLSATVDEALSDIFFTMLFPLILGITRFLSEKIEEEKDDDPFY